MNAQDQTQPLTPEQEGALKTALPLLRDSGNSIDRLAARRIAEMVGADAEPIGDADEKALGEAQCIADWGVGEYLYVDPELSPQTDDEDRVMRRDAEEAVAVWRLAEKRFGEGVTPRQIVAKAAAGDKFAEAIGALAENSIALVWRERPAIIAAIAAEKEDAIAA